ncbi:MAG: hypothetical protein OEZ40_08740, partial [Candidatus Bathyarchaeota archaeon]|nr:hypothetical protein [Candidatus Bathyarchaeota archaeon]
MQEMTSSGRSFNDIKLVFLGITIMLLACSYIADAMVKNIIIGNTGVILPLFEVTASSGSAADIQTAVDQVAAVAERGKVHIPPGNFNFVNVGEEWRTVNVPAGIDILGASSPKEAVSEHAGITHSGYFNEGFFDSPSSGTWLTVLQMPWDVPDFNNWFDIIGDWHSPKPTRFSDIKIQGYRSFNSSSITRHCGINIIGVIDFRIDHCMFEHVTWGAVGIPLLYQQNLECNGVIDHCKFINIHGYDNLVNGANSTIGYGISIGRAYYAASGQVPVPFDPTMDILGKYNTHAVFIEDCYFSKWRHCVTAHHGGYYVFRHNIINLDFGHWSLDVHGLR